MQNDKRKVSSRVTHFREKKWFTDDVDSFMGRHRIDDRTKGIHTYVLDLKETIEKLKEHSCQDTSLETTPEMPSKEEHKKLIQNDPPYVPINPMNPLNVECNFHAYNPKTGKHFCEDKEIDPYVCLNRYQRMTFKGGKCYPKHREKEKNERKLKSHRVFCKRDSVWINYGDKDCLACTWQPSECPVKRRVLKYA